MDNAGSRVHASVKHMVTGRNVAGQYKSVLYQASVYSTACSKRFCRYFASRWKVLAHYSGPILTNYTNKIILDTTQIHSQLVESVRLTLTCLGADLGMIG